MRSGKSFLPLLLLLVATQSEATEGRPRIPSKYPVAVSHSVSQKPTSRPVTHVPIFAEILGVRVGIDTMEKLEGRIGEGAVCAGGHSHGGRRWNCNRNSVCISSDAFYYRNHRPYGRVLNYVTIFLGPGSTQVEGNTIPNIHESSHHLQFMNVVKLGMSRATVRHLLAAKLPPPTISDSDLVWSAKGYVHTNSVPDEDTHSWEARLHFVNDHLSEIGIVSDNG